MKNNNWKALNNVVRSFTWKIFSRDDEETFLNARKVSVIKGEKIENTLYSLMKEYLKKNKLDFTPVTEGELYETLKDTALQVSRVSLHKWRNDKIDEFNGQKLWFTDGNNIVYNLEAMKDFIGARR